MGYTPIGEYAIIGNDDRFALVNQEGSIDWCCFPHGAAPSVFASLLDDERGGHFAIRPTDTHDVERDYVDRTNVLETTFETRSGRATVTDFMPVGDGAQSEQDQHALYRRVACTDGTLTLELECKPRFDYARVSTTFDVAEGEHTGPHYVATGADERLSLQIHGAFDTRVIGDRVVGTETVAAGETNWVVLQYDQFDPVSPSTCQSQLDGAIEYWQTWTDELLDAAAPIVEDDSWRTAVIRSSLVLKLLINEETGAIYAAATTSLPEEYGGDRNWDYRYNWIRDAKFTIQALYNLGRKAEANAYFEWFREISHEAPESIQPLYGVHGEAELTEHELTHLSGYRHSAPVRIGNAATEQRQLDIYGAIVQAYYETLRHDDQLTDDDWASIRSIVDHVCEVWQEPDDGIWEVRDEPRHYVHSKLLCWVALDRGIELAEHFDRTAPIETWTDERAALRSAIIERGYSDEAESFVQHFDTDEALDATCLLIPIYGFLPADDDRVEATINTVLDQLLADECLLYRTRNSDVLPDEGGTFVLCTFWLIDALVLAGRLEKASALFSHVLEHTTPLGLLSERIDPETGELLGNFPQVYSHLGLINSAIYLASVRLESGTLEHEPVDAGDSFQPLFRK